MIDFLPLGSVVTLKTHKDMKLLIIDRAVEKKDSFFSRPKFVDYCGVLYPVGFVGAKVLNFQKSEIEKVIFKGFDNEANKRSLEIINENIQRRGMRGR